MQRNMRTPLIPLIKMAWLVALLHISAGIEAFAHDPGLSTMTVQLSATRIEVCATFARKEIETLFLAQETALDTSLKQLASNALVIERDGQLLQPATSLGRFSGEDNFEFTVTFATQPNGRLVIRSPILHKLAPGHRQLLTVADIDSKTLDQRLLSAAADHARLETRHAADRQQPAFTRHLLPACSLMVALVGSFWLLRRLRLL